jgi:hypothetical protein
MRHRYANQFDRIFIDNLHGDRKISEYAPDGRTSETIFSTASSSPGIRIGTAISTFVRTRASQNSGAIHYRDFEQAKAAERRQALLGAITEDVPPYERLELNRELGMPFKPRTYTSQYLEWPKFSELFPESSPGVQTGRDDLLVDILRETVEHRMAQYLSPYVTDDEADRLAPGIMKDSARFNAKEVRQALQAKGYRPWQIIHFAYRPFDARWLYWEPTTKLLDENRKEYVAAYQSNVPAMYLAQKNRREFDPPGVTCLIANRHLNERGANIFPLSTIGSPVPGKIESRANLSPQAQSYITERQSDEHWLFFHALATMHTPVYRSENSGALVSDWPRIPLPATQESLSRSAELGNRLARLLDSEYPVTLPTEWSFLSALRLPPITEPERALTITAGWGYRGQGATVMPGRGTSRERDWTEIEHARIDALAAAQGLSAEVLMSFLGATCIDVYLNGDAWWSAVPANVWEYTRGGYQVLKKWLSYRESSVLGRGLMTEEAAWFAQVVRRISAILLMGPALDESYRAIASSAVPLPG